jgi:hypothetical protein
MHGATEPIRRQPKPSVYVLPLESGIKFLIPAKQELKVTNDDKLEHSYAYNGVTI